MDSDGAGLVGERGPAGERGTGPTGDASRMAWMLAIGHWWRGLIGLQYATRQEQSRRMNRRRHDDNSRAWRPPPSVLQLPHSQEPHATSSRGSPP